MITNIDFLFRRQMPGGIGTRVKIKKKNELPHTHRETFFFFFFSK